tara:strand:- start:461 stop:760 length:300 start_codon:yes stop_codon:yes gene_type:complete
MKRKDNTNERRRMKLSEVNITATNGNEGIRVETTTDAYRVMWICDRFGDAHRENYIEQFGDVEVEYDDEWNVYRVPAFKEQIDKYSEAKQRHCERWGSN